MSIHQIIYTSCMRGINGVNDGQQVFSYDAQFTGANNDEVKSLFSYQPPMLEPGVIMTEEIAATLPRSFVYRRLGDGTCALALSTYLGRDYMGSAGRFGNHLSHVVIADEDDIKNYPCEFYGSDLLRDHMEFEEVNNPNCPDFLPTPVLTKGYTVDIDAVMEFLSVGDRLEVYKSMLHAMLAFERERKRVVICDEPEHVIMWIAALQYALPLRNALNINFTTYEYDPSLSESQICGVLERGTRFDAESRRLHFVFDLYQNSYPSFGLDGEFYDFIDTAFSLSYDSIQDFHAFLTNGYSYRKADEEIYSAYTLYSLLSDGIGSITQKKLDAALEFAQNYATVSEKLKVVQNVLSQYNELMSVDKWIFLSIMKFILVLKETVMGNELGQFKNIIIDRVLGEFSNGGTTEDAFVRLYDDIDSMCKQSGFSLATELMRTENRTKLFAVMRNEMLAWKIAFIVKVVSNYVKDQNISVNNLTVEAPLGQIYYGIVQAVYTKNAKNGFYLVTKILDEFNFDCQYLVNMALSVEGMLYDVPNGNHEVASMWKYFGQLMIQSHVTDLSTAYAILNKYQRYDEIYMLYALSMSNATSLSECQRIFNEHFKEFVLRERVYEKQYKIKILTDYYEQLEHSGESAVSDAKKNLFDILTTEKIKVDFAEDLVNQLVNEIPFEKLSKENSKLIQTAFQYIYNDLHRPIEGRLFLFVVALALLKCKKTGRLKEVFDMLQKMLNGGKADLARIRERELEKYFEWILPEVCGMFEYSDDMESFYELFDMPKGVETVFFVTCAKVYLKQSKEEKSYEIFCEYLDLVFKYGNSYVRKDIGEVLSKLNKKKLEELDDAVMDMYHKDRRAVRYWDEIKEVAETTNTILNSILKALKIKKD